MQFADVACALKAQTAILSAQLPECDGAGGGDIQRIDAVGHGDLDRVITGGNRRAGQPVALGAQHDGKLRLGGKGRVIGTMFGCIFLNTLFNGFSQMGVDPFVQDVLKGVVLVLAVTLDVASNKKKS